jgi:O-antigen/teichoic acid export membrane protein
MPSPDIEKGSPIKEDLTGRDRLVANVIFSWAAHLVFLVAGFIMPRMIDRRLGQELLGIWDFAWSLVSYFSLVQMGIVSGVNRYVANYRANSDIAGVNRVASSASLVLGVGAVVVMALTAGFSLSLPRLFGSRLGENMQEAQRVVFFLGASVATEVAFAVFTGILTGCHRWALDSINTSGWHAATVAGMITTLLLGGQLWVLAAITFAGGILAGVGRVVFAHRACQGLRLRLSLVTWATIQELLAFGGKTLIPSVSNLLLNQTTSILIMSYLGPAALALYSRPRSLMQQSYTLVRKMGLTLTPTVSSLQSRGDLNEIRDLLMKATRYSCYLTLPGILTLVVFGGPIMQLWMGSSYANGLIPAILATGYLTVLMQIPAWNVLAGLNAHGRVGLARFIASACSVVLNLLVLSHFHWGLVGTAVAVALPLMILNLVDIPLIVCRRFNLDVKRYYASVGIVPVVHVLPFAICLITCRILFREAPLTGLAVGMGTGVVLLGVLYWYVVFPERLKQRLSRPLSWRKRLHGKEYSLWKKSAL